MRLKRETKKFSEISKRLNSVLKKDKKMKPEYLEEVLKSDIFYLINNYFEVDFCDIDVNIDVGEDNRYDISISILGERMKIMRTIPN